MNTQPIAPMLLSTPETPNGSCRLCFKASQAATEASSQGKKPSKGVQS